MRSSSARSTFGSGSADPLAGGSGAYDDVFGGPPKFAPPSYPSQTQSAQNFDDIFRALGKSASSNKGSSLPVFDAPLYDDDIFGGVPGIRNANVVYDDVFSGGSTPGPSPAAFEDLLGGFGTADSRERTTRGPVFDSAPPSAGESAFDELLPGFGGSEPAKSRSAGDGKPSHRKSPSPAATAANDPFVILESTPAVSSASVPSVSDLGPFKSSARSSAGSTGNDYSNGVSDDPAYGNSSPSSPATPFTANKSVNTTRESRRRKDFASPALSPTRVNASTESTDGSSGRRNHSNSDRAKDQTKISSSIPKPELQTKMPSSTLKREADAPVSSAEAATHSPSRRYRQVPREAAASPHRLKSEDPTELPKVPKTRQADEFWISIEDIKLVTKPTTAPPPSRPPPAPGSKQGYATKKPLDAKTTVDQDSVTNLNAFSAGQNSAGSSRHQSQRASESSMKASLDNSANTIDELEEFASGVSRAHKGDVASSTPEEEQSEESSAAAASAVAMKEAMERAEAKLKLAKESKDRERGERERERDTRAARVRDEREKAREAREREGKETVLERGEQEREGRADYEKDDREREEREREARERRRKEREKEKEREREREREKDRIAVERATQEARERAAAEARERAERIAAENRERAAMERDNERIAVERATQEARERAAADARERAERIAAETRERAERAAVERATGEARDRAAADARERAAERAAVERAASEARARAERAAVERVNAEARARAAERAAAEARERADRAAAERATAAREQHRRNENDLESFFMSTSARPTSAPRQRPPTADSSSDGRQSNKGFSSEGLRRGSNSVRKVPSTPNITDDWASLLSGTPAPGEFQDVEGETSERRRARWDRHQRTLERAAKALDEKNQRDLQAQRDQAERHRAAETLDAEIKRWAAGKEGNLRALLSTLQYVLWPECSWQAVSLTDLITAASVKKVYRRATLCVHPDKVQQKGATIQQRYIAEKVFDLLKEAWNKFNSEELF